MEKFIAKWNNKKNAFSFARKFVKIHKKNTKKI
jgi:hypothetical protein